MITSLADWIEITSLMLFYCDSAIELSFIKNEPKLLKFCNHVQYAL